jgi:hypothetical protein
MAVEAMSTSGRHAIPQVLVPLSTRAKFGAVLMTLILARDEPPLVRR